MAGSRRNVRLAQYLIKSQTHPASHVGVEVAIDVELEHDLELYLE